MPLQRFRASSGRLARTSRAPKGLRQSIDELCPGVETRGNRLYDDADERVGHEKSHFARIFVWLAAKAALDHNARLAPMPAAALRASRNGCVTVVARPLTAARAIETPRLNSSRSRTSRAA